MVQLYWREHVREQETGVPDMKVTAAYISACLRLSDEAHALGAYELLREKGARSRWMSVDRCNHSCVMMMRQA
jgi:hypothetical protein